MKLATTSLILLSFSSVLLLPLIKGEEEEEEEEYVEHLGELVTAEEREVLEYGGLAVREKEDVDPTRHECERDEDCEPYSYCHSSIFTGETCRTFMDPQAKTKSKRRKCHDTKNGNEFPAHTICTFFDTLANPAGTPSKFSTSRCFPQLNFTCAKSYFMPCTHNYDERDGSVIKGQEEACPENFSCEERTYVSLETKEETKVKLCVAKEEGSTSNCKTNFDCGYSREEDRWTVCNVTDGRCDRKEFVLVPLT